MFSMRTDPFGALAEFQRALDAYRASDWLGGRTGATGTFPPINVFRQGDDYVAIVELAGVNKDELAIEAKNDMIRLSGRKAPDYPQDASTHRRERLFGSFDRTIAVPIRIDAEGVRAEYRDGILALYIPRRAEDRPRRIDIGGATQ